MIKKIRYRLVWNRSGCLNQRGEGLVQIEAEQQKRKIYFSTHTYVLPEQFQNGCIINASNAEASKLTSTRLAVAVRNAQICKSRMLSFAVHRSA